MRRYGLLCMTALLAISAASWSAAAHPVKVKHRVHHFSDAKPSEDAVELGYLAPPTRLTTLKQDYGDAAFARSRYAGRYPAETEPTYGLALGSNEAAICDPRVASSRGYICPGSRRTIGYGQLYAFTPSHVSSPQVVGEPSNSQDEVLPPATALFWAVDGLRYDPHN